MKFIVKNWKVIAKGIGALAGAVMMVGLGKSVIDETCYETRELGDLVTEDENDEEDVF